MADVSIGTIQELVAFSNGDYGRGASGSPISVVLTADLDFNDLKEHDMPYNWAGCTGTWYVNFDGQGHKVDNIYYMGATEWGFFGTVYGKVENLKLPNLYVTTTSNSYCSGVVLYLYGKINNVSVSGRMESMGNGVVTGIVSRMGSGSVVSFCSFSGLAKSASGTSLGIALNTFSGTGYIYSCGVIADLIGGYDVGVFGSASTYAVNCFYRGKVTSPRQIWYGYNATIKTCYFVIDPESTFSTGGYSVVTNCYYDSTIWTGGNLPALTPATTAELKDSTWLKEHDFAI